MVVMYNESMWMKEEGKEEDEDRGREDSLKACRCIKGELQTKTAQTSRSGRIISWGSQPNIMPLSIVPSLPFLFSSVARPLSSPLLLDQE